MTPAADRRQVTLGGTLLEYRLRRSTRRRTIGLRVDAEGLLVTAPLRAADARIEAALQSLSGWVLRQIERRPATPPAPEWRDGATLPLLGRPLRLAVRSGRAHTAFDDDTLHLATPTPHDSSALAAGIERALRRRALQHFTQRATELGARLGVHPQRVLLTSARTRWGSCTRAGVWFWGGQDVWC